MHGSKWRGLETERKPPRQPPTLLTNPPADHLIDGVWVTTDYKGPGKHRAIYELLLR